RACLPSRTQREYPPTTRKYREPHKQTKAPTEVGAQSSLLGVHEPTILPQDGGVGKVLRRM
ncbi:MAG: hypothetical protein WBW33_19595, partial [Bryobacteraceae bacterium]